MDEGPIVAAGPAEAPFRPLVAFDFDGTLTCRDSFLSFLPWRYGRRRYAQAIARLGPSLVRFVRDRDRGRLKANLVGELMVGESREALAAAAERFAAECARSLLRPDAVKCWRAWQKRNARLVIVTASPEFLVAPFGRGLGAEAVIGTRLAFSNEDRATGALDGRNCRADEKVARLREAFGDDVRLEAAYGDSGGDTAMLAIADEAGMKVFGQKP
ncbi:MAG TPA: HAD-IB family hydrolase [Caulobacteraceae bacterium]|nr:HAD-IB family hydrolase [Caulobacteraceae bacterium]